MRIQALTRQGLPENKEPQQSREDEIGTRVDHTDANCTARQSKGSGEEAPHYSIEEEVHAEEELGKWSRSDKRSTLQSWTMSDTYASYEYLNGYALFFETEEVGQTRCP